MVYRFGLSKLLSLIHFVLITAFTVAGSSNLLCQNVGVVERALGANQAALNAIPIQGSAGTDFAISMAVPSIEPWSVVSAPTWLNPGGVRVYSPGNGIGCGTGDVTKVTYACFGVTANVGPIRNGVIVINIPTLGNFGINITQSGNGGSAISAEPFSTWNSTSLSAIPSAGSNGSSLAIALRGPQNATWRVVSGPSWAAPLLYAGISGSSTSGNRCIGQGPQQYVCFQVSPNRAKSRSDVLIVESPGLGTTAFNLIQLGLPSGPCSPTAKQLLNRTSISALYVNDTSANTNVTGFYVPPPTPKSPQMMRYCDPQFGTDVLLLGGQADKSLDEGTDSRGQLGFNYNSTKIATVVTNGTVRVYSIDPLGLTASNPVTLSPIYYNGERISIDATTAFWSGDPTTPNVLIYASGLRVFSFTLNADNTINQSTVAKIADFAAEFGNNRAMRRCSASRTAKRIGCSVQETITWSRIGYVVFDLTTTSPGYHIVVSHINSGANPTEIPNFQRAGSGDYVYTLYNPRENGYKFYIDRSGQYAVFYGDFVNQALPGVDSLQSAAVLNLSNLQFGFLQGTGHGDLGPGFALAINSGAGSCVGCLKKWDLATLSSDPTPLIYLNNVKFSNGFDTLLTYPGYPTFPTFTSDNREGVPVSNFPREGMPWLGAAPGFRPVVATDNGLWIQGAHWPNQTYISLSSESPYAAVYFGDNQVPPPDPSYVQHPAFSDEIIVHQVACDPLQQDCQKPLCDGLLHLPNSLPSPTNCLLMTWQRLARTYNTSVRRFGYIQPIQSRDGKLIAFPSNLGDPNNSTQVLIVRAH